MRVGILFGLIALVFLIGSVIPFSDAVEKNKPIFVPPQARIIVLGKLYHADSFILRNALGHRLYAPEIIEYINNANAVINIPDEVPRSNADSLHAYHLVRPPSNKPLHARFFDDMFQYFSAYDVYFFLSALALGGLTFLFIFSFIMALIVKIDLLYLFGGFSGIALYTSAIKQYHLPIYTHVSNLDLANIILYLNIGMLLALLKYLHKLKANQHRFFSISMRSWFIGLLVLFAALFITSSVWVDVFQITLLLALVVYAYFAIYRFTRGISPSFKWLIDLGIPLALLHWSTLVFEFSSNPSMLIDAAVLFYYIVLASFIAEQILSEFNNSIALNQENLQMEIELGARQILSVENERKRMVQDLHQDVITRITDLANHSNHDALDYTRIEAESKATLESLRDYSYSLYPPYLEQLSLKNVLQRELDRFTQLDSWAVIEINEPEGNHFEPVFKLWIYRVLKEYIVFFCRHTKPQKLHLCLNFTSPQDWELCISHQLQDTIEVELYQALSADIEIYTAYYGAVFEEIDDPFQKGWRFLKEATKAAKEVQVPHENR